MILTEDIAESLVWWSLTYATGLRLPADRPWYRTEAPQHDRMTARWPCRCGKALITAKRYLCDDRRLTLYLGQCGRCQIVCFAFGKAREPQAGPQP